jgi:hypothetical protein
MQLFCALNDLILTVERTGNSEEDASKSCEMQVESGEVPGSRVGAIEPLKTTGCAYSSHSLNLCEAIS